MPILTFKCPKCKEWEVSFEYADYSFDSFVRQDKNYFEKINCHKCGKELLTVPWIAVIDEEKENEVITIV